MSNQTPQVIKIGGAEDVNMQRCARDLARLWQEGQALVVVHGGSAAVNQVAEQMGHPSQTIVSPTGHESRRTDKETLDIFTMVCAGRVNKALVQALQEAGVPAVGLTGLDGRMIQARRKQAVRAVQNGRTVVIHDDYSGIIQKVDPRPVQAMLQAGFLPVVGPPAAGEPGEVLNVDADRLASRLALALGAERVIFLSNVPGLLEDPGSPETLVTEIPGQNLEEYMSLARGRMGKKLLAIAELLADGVREVVLGDGRLEQPVTAAQMGKGTVIR